MSWPVRMALVLIAFSVVASVRAQQPDPSLTKEFPKLSPKERSRIAAKETSEAAQDQVYQTVMQEAERAFQEGRYEDALAGYEKARTQRPYNVYPKVKIQDLKALLKRKEDEEKPPASPPGATTQATNADDGVEQAGAAPTVKEATSAAPTPANAHAAAPIPAGTTVTTTAPAPTTAHSQTVTKPKAPTSTPKAPAPRTEARLAPPADGGMEERRYQEGHAFVIERTISVEGRRVVYKRVAHPMGQVFFFEDGIAVDERVWKARFP